MPDDHNKKGPQDAQRINIGEDYELRYWTKALGVTPDQLKEAVRAVGVMVMDVRRKLGK